MKISNPPYPSIEGNYRDDLYIREYSHDLPNPTNLASRVALAAIPLLTLHPSLCLPISLAMGSIRVINSTTKVDKGLVILSLTSTLFRSTIGAVLTTIHDTVLEVGALQSSQTKSEASVHLLKICNNLISLALRCRGGLELYLISSAFNIAVSLLSSVQEFKKDHWIEGAAHLLMVGGRLYQLNEKQNIFKQLKETHHYIQSKLTEFLFRNNQSIQDEIRDFSPDLLNINNTDFLSELFAKRHSGNHFDERPLNNKQLVSLIQAARWAPSSYNDQPWNFIFCSRDTHPEAYSKVIDSIYGQEWVEKAPLLVISVIRPTFSYNQKENGWAQYDTGAAAFSMSLRATELGLMTHQIGGFDPEAICQEFHLPERHQPITIIAIGYEDTSFVRPGEEERVRNPIDQNFFFGDWGSSLNRYLTSSA